ncbi:MAG: hypothetical protein ABIK20_00385 [Candidatus Omnitrophota bacterium]
MKVWIYVEGPSDRSGLDAFWEEWRLRLKQAHWGIQVIPLDNKSRFFRKIGPRAAEKLLANSHDLVVGLPDYYPNQPNPAKEYPHATLEELCNLQYRLVRDILVQKAADVNGLIQRFYPSALKHDLEMLLLAAREQLCAHLGTPDSIGQQWQHPVENQNQNRPPKRVVEELYLTKKGKAYRDTKDAGTVLGNVNNLRQILYSQSGQLLECPVFKSMLDWIGSRTGVRAY